MNELQSEIDNLRRQMATLSTDQPQSDRTTKRSRIGSDTKKSKRKLGQPQDAPPTTDADAAADRMRRLGGEFVIMHMLWLSNASAAFRETLSSTYTPLDRFKNALQGRRQGEHADLRAAIPEEFHGDFGHEYMHRVVRIFILCSYIIYMMP